MAKLSRTIFSAQRPSIAQPSIEGKGTFLQLIRHAVHLAHGEGISNVVQTMERDSPFSVAIDRSNEVLSSLHDALKRPFWSDLIDNPLSSLDISRSTLQSDGVDDRGQTLRNLSAERRFSFCFPDEVERISARVAR